MESFSGPCSHAFSPCFEFMGVSFGTLPFSGVCDPLPKGGAPACYEVKSSVGFSHFTIRIGFSRLVGG